MSVQNIHSLNKSENHWDYLYLSFEKQIIRTRNKKQKEYRILLYSWSAATINPCLTSSSSTLWLESIHKTTWPLRPSTFLLLIPFSKMDFLLTDVMWWSVLHRKKASIIKFMFWMILTHTSHCFYQHSKGY